MRALIVILSTVIFTNCNDTIDRLDHCVEVPDAGYAGSCPLPEDQYKYMLIPFKHTVVPYFLYD